MNFREGYIPSEEEKEFIKNYNPGDYPRPSVTADIAVFTITPEGNVAVLLIKRGNYPYKGLWAIPGGFLEVGKESVDDTAKRELQEETGITDAALHQLYTFSKPDRDPRLHTVSVVYTTIVPYSELNFKAGDDAIEARLFDVTHIHNGHWVWHDSEMELRNHEIGIRILEKDLAFDHVEVLRMAIAHIRNLIHSI